MAAMKPTGRKYRFGTGGIYNCGFADLYLAARVAWIVLRIPKMLKHEIIVQVNLLEVPQQRKVLDFVRV